VVDQDRFKIRTFVWPNGNCPSQEFYDKIKEKKVRSKFIAIWDAIRESDDGQAHDPDKLAKLHGEHTYDLWEMRVEHRHIWYRVLCFRDGPDWVMTHGFTKDTNDTDPDEIKRGAAMKKAYEATKAKSARGR
jgi:hypothetical protein